MPTYVKGLALGLWTIVVIAMYVFVGVQFTQDQLFSGTRITFETGRDLQIDATSVTLEAASANFFLLRKETGELIAGAPAKPPLGWPSQSYFTFGPGQVAGGKWLSPNGSATFKILSDDPVTVRAIFRDPPPVWIVWTIIIFCIWILGIAFVM